MKFVALLKGKKANTLETGLLEKHIEHLRFLHKTGALFLCGPFEDNDGAIQILEAGSYEEAERYVLLDPFVKEGYYPQVSIHQLIEANEGNNYLMGNDEQTKANIKK